MGRYRKYGSRGSLFLKKFLVISFCFAFKRTDLLPYYPRLANGVVIAFVTALQTSRLLRCLPLKLTEIHTTGTTDLRATVGDGPESHRS